MVVTLEGRGYGYSTGRLNQKVISMGTTQKLLPGGDHEDMTGGQNLQPEDGYRGGRRV